MAVSKMYYAVFSCIRDDKDGPHVVRLSSNDCLAQLHQHLLNAGWLLSSCPYSCFSYELFIMRNLCHCGRLGLVKIGQQLLGWWI